MAKKHHKYSHTTVKHHDDGSHTTTHHHESGDPKDNKEYATADHDGMVDGMMDHTSAPNPGEAEAQAGPAAPMAGAAGAMPAGV